jgi:hypothetical protein
MSHSNRFTPWIALALLGVSGACSGRTYTAGVVTREKANFGLVDFQRDEQRESWSLFCEPFLTCGSTATGNQYTDVFGGLLRAVNIPGVAMVLFYPFQYHDQPDATAHVFGIGSGEGDLRLSLLWGMISLGRHWNVFWMNGFWIGKDDPLFTPPTDAARTYYESITLGTAPS